MDYVSCLTRVGPRLQPPCLLTLRAYNYGIAALRHCPAMPVWGHVYIFLSFGGLWHCRLVLLGCPLVAHACVAAGGAWGALHAQEGVRDKPNHLPPWPHKWRGARKDLEQIHAGKNSMAGRGFSKLMCHPCFAVACVGSTTSNACDRAHVSWSTNRLHNLSLLPTPTPFVVHWWGASLTTSSALDRIRHFGNVALQRGLGRLISALSKCGCVIGVASGGGVWNARCGP